MIGSLIKSLFGGGSDVEVEIPEWIGLILHSDEDLLKGAGHKYIRRVPTGNPKKPWKYFYKVSGGSGLGHHSEFLEGAAFKVAHGGKEGHFHILGVDGDRLKIKHDETGEESTLTKDALTSLLHKEHAKAIGEHKERLKKELVAVSKHGSEKQKAKIKSEADKAGVSEEKPKSEDPVARSLAEYEEAKKKISTLLDHTRSKASGIQVKGETVYLGKEGRLWTMLESRKEAEAYANILHALTGDIESFGDIVADTKSPQYKALVWAQKNQEAMINGAKASVKNQEDAKVSARGSARASATDSERDFLDRVIASAFRVDTPPPKAERDWLVRRPEHKGHASVINTATGQAYLDKKEAREKDVLAALREIKTGEPKGDLKHKPKYVSEDRLKAFTSKDPTRPGISWPFDWNGFAVATDGHRAILAPSATKHNGEDPGIKAIAKSLDTDIAATIDADLLRPVLDLADKVGALRQHVGDADDVISTISFRIKGDRLEAGSHDVNRWFPVGSSAGFIGKLPPEGIKLNAPYVRDAIKGAKVVQIGSPESSMSPFAIHRGDGEKHLIMPMRI